MSEEFKLPHDSARTYSETKGKDFYYGFISLQEKEPGRGEFVIIALLIIFAVFSGSFVGFLLNNNVVNPPKEVIGVCPPPAFIQNNNCFQSVTSTDAQGNTHVVISPAGTIIGAANCQGNQCLVNPGG